MKRKLYNLKKFVYVVFLFSHIVKITLPYMVTKKTIDP